MHTTQLIGILVSAAVLIYLIKKQKKKYLFLLLLPLFSACSSTSQYFNEPKDTFLGIKLGEPVNYPKCLTTLPNNANENISRYLSQRCIFDEDSRKLYIFIPITDNPLKFYVHDFYVSKTDIERDYFSVSTLSGDYELVLDYLISRYGEPEKEMGYQNKSIEYKFYIDKNLTVGFEHKLLPSNIPNSDYIYYIGGKKKEAQSPNVINNGTNEESKQEIILQ